MKKFSVIIAGIEPVIVNADSMIVEEGRLVFKNGETLVATFSYAHIICATEIQEV